MTEADFATCKSPRKMLEFLRGCRISDRKLRLFTVACCRRLEMWLPDQRSWDAVHVSEWYADGNGTEEDLAAARGDAEASFQLDRAAYAAVAATAPAAWEAAVGAVDAVNWIGWEWYEEGEEREQGQTALLRDIFGPLPFRNVAIDASWRMPPVIALAAAIYEERAWNDMPILGDALQEAGCKNAEVLGHCRDQGPHCRGCWVVDLVLKKE